MTKTKMEMKQVEKNKDDEKRKRVVRQRRFRS